MTKSITAPGWGGGVGAGKRGSALLHAYKGRATRQGISMKVQKPITRSV